MMNHMLVLFFFPLGYSAKRSHSKGVITWKIARMEICERISAKSKEGEFVLVTDGLLIFQSLNGVPLKSENMVMFLRIRVSYIDFCIML